MTQIINNKLKKICDNCRNDKSCAWISLGNEYCDDIMEAQKEIEKLKKEKKKLSNDLAEAILFNQKRCEQNKELQQRIDRLKEENRHIFANVNDDVLLRSNAMNYAELQECKKRIDKAIEYIKENAGYDEEISSCCDDLLYSDCDKLIELLGGNE